MKKIYLLLVFLFLAGCSFSCKTNFIFSDNNQARANETYKNEFRGVWVCTVYRMDYPSAYTKNSQILKNDIDAIIQNSVEYGFNAIIFQVRPAADAFYKSSIFPWSKYLTGTQGQAPDNGFDPLKYIIEKCHQSNLELHAWINPYRVTAQASDKLISGHVALGNPEYTVNYQDKLYFNPGVEAVRKVIIDGVKEIVENYNIDGIHFDDYFYPDKSFNDAESFLKYSNGFLDIENWRRNNNDLLVKETYDAIKMINPSVKFGLSPPGIWANKSYNILGSQTNGFQAYYDIYADSLKWVKNNWLDYIVPQVYWHIGNSSANYSVLLNWWADAVKNTNVKLYMGMACYKADDISYGAVWQGGDEIERQIVLNRTKSEVYGMVFFRYLDVLTKPGIQLQAKNYFIFDNPAPEEELEEKPDEALNKTQEELEQKPDEALNKTQEGLEEKPDEALNRTQDDKKKDDAEFQKKHWIIAVILTLLLLLSLLIAFIKRYYLKRR